MPAKGWRKAPDGTWTPPNQMVHTLEIEEDTREWIHDEAQRLILIHEGGQAVRGFLSTNAGALLAGGGIIVTLLAFKPTRDAALRFLTFIREQTIDFFQAFLGQAIPASARAIIDELRQRLIDLQAALADALQIEDELNATECPPGEHLEFVTTPAGLIPQCVPDEPAQ